MAASNAQDRVGGTLLSIDYGLGNGRLLVHVYQHPPALRSLLVLFDFA